jgi:hypothetical protein
MTKESLIANELTDYRTVWPDLGGRLRVEQVVAPIRLVRLNDGRLAMRLDVAPNTTVVAEISEKAFVLAAAALVNDRAELEGERPPNEF